MKERREQEREEDDETREDIRLKRRAGAYLRPAAAWSQRAVGAQEDMLPLCFCCPLPSIFAAGA